MIAQGHGDAAMLQDPENAFGFACRQLLFPGPRIADRVGAGREHVDALRLPGRQRPAVFTERTL